MTAALVRLVEIGRLRNGRAIYLPEPEYDVIALDALESPWSLCYVLDALVADQQRIADALT